MFLGSQLHLGKKERMAASLADSKIEYLFVITHEYGQLITKLEILRHNQPAGLMHAVPS